MTNSLFSYSSEVILTFTDTSLHHSIILFDGNNIISCWREQPPELKFFEPRLVGSPTWTLTRGIVESNRFNFYTVTPSAMDARYTVMILDFNLVGDLQTDTI